MTRRDIIALLKAGKHPRDLGAYELSPWVWQIGRWIVKDGFLTADYETARKACRQLRLRLVPTHFVKYDMGEWSVQPYRKPLTYAQRLRWDRRCFPQNPLDLHGGNIGRDERGRYWVFDW